MIYLAGLNIFAPVLRFMLEDYRLSIIFVVIIVYTSFFNNRSISCSCPLCPFCILEESDYLYFEAATTCVTFYVARRIWYFYGDGNGYCDRSYSVMDLFLTFVFRGLFTKAGIQIGHHSKHVVIFILELHR